MSIYDKMVLADNPFGYWKLDEASGATAADSSGNGLDATITGTGFTYEVPVDGKIVSGISGDGNGYIAFPSLSSAMTYLEFSLEFWFYTGSDIDLSSTLKYVFGSSVANTFLFYTGNGAGTDDFAGVSVTGSRTSWKGSARTITEISTGWHHVVLTQQIGRDSWTLYVDGNAVGSREVSGVMPPVKGALASWYMMRHNGTNYSATLSSVAMYGYMLSPSQVRRHYEANVLDVPVPRKGYVWDAANSSWVHPDRPAKSFDFNDELDVKNLRIIGSKAAASECYRNGGWLNFKQFRTSDDFRVVFPVPAGVTGFSFSGIMAGSRNRFGSIPTVMILSDNPPSSGALNLQAEMNGMGIMIASDTDFFSAASGVSPFYTSISPGASIYGANNAATGYHTLGAGSDFHRVDIDVSFNGTNVVTDGTVTGPSGVVATGTRSVGSPSWAGSVPTWTHFVIGSFVDLHGTSGAPDYRYWQQVILRSIQFT